MIQVEESVDAVQVADSRTPCVQIMTRPGQTGRQPMIVCRRHRDWPTHRFPVHIFPRYIFTTHFPSRGIAERRSITSIAAIKTTRRVIVVSTPRHRDGQIIICAGGRRKRFSSANDNGCWLRGTKSCLKFDST